MAQKQVQAESPETVPQMGNGEIAAFATPVGKSLPSLVSIGAKNGLDTHPAIVQGVRFPYPADKENRPLPQKTRRCNSQESMRLMFEEQLAQQVDQRLETVTALIQTLRAQFHEVAAAVLSPVLNRYLDNAPQETLEQKRVVATNVNATLRSVGLAISCPENRNPAMLIADWTKSRKYSRFQYDVHLPTGGRDHVTIGCKKLANVELVQDTQRVESLSSRFKKTDDRSL